MVVASIDLMGGKAVQLRQGKDKILEHDDPVQLAKTFGRLGDIAVVDLDAAMGQGTNRPIIKQLLKIADCRVGGGVRTVEHAQELISMGAKKVIIGSQAFAGDKINRGFLKELAVAIPRERLMIAVDAVDGTIVTQGWKHNTGLDVFETVAAIENFAGEFLFTNVEREGTMTGIDMKIVKKMRESTRNAITVAGGVYEREQIAQISKLGLNLQLGMALYTGKITLEDAFLACLHWKEKLLPVVVQDNFGQVLMLAYMNEEAVKQTLETGRMCYYSRSRKALWVKGETSGNSQKMLRLRADCDRDSLLATVQQKGVACHTGSYSCFGDKIFTYQDLYEVVEDRILNPVHDSFTAKMQGDVLKAKILEEAQEVVDSETEDEIVWEVADILYFLCVFLARHRIPFTHILHELRRRRKK